MRDVALLRLEILNGLYCLYRSAITPIGQR